MTESLRVVMPPREGAFVRENIEHFRASLYTREGEWASNAWSRIQDALDDIGTDVTSASPSALCLYAKLLPIAYEFLCDYDDKRVASDAAGAVRDMIVRDIASFNGICKCIETLARYCEFSAEQPYPYEDNRRINAALADIHEVIRKFNAMNKGAP